MFRFVKAVRDRTIRPDFWLAGVFARSPHPDADQAMAMWSEHLGRASAELWVAACKIEGRRQ